MTPEQLFTAGNMSGLAGWVLLIVLPRFPIVARLIVPVGVCGLLGLVYLYLIVTNLGGAEGGFGSLEGLSQLFQNEQVLMAGWYHYLAFDLFIGCWEVRDARRNGIPHWLIIPAMLLTFMLGPVGLLVYFAIRFVRIRSLDLEESAAVSPS